jgi:hypothetical protein
MLCNYVDGGQEWVLVCADPVARTPNSVSKNFVLFALLAWLPFFNLSGQSNYPVEMLKTFPLAPMGVLAPHLHTLDVAARPSINTSEICLAHLFAESPLNISPNLSEVISKVPETFEFFKKNIKRPKNGPSRGPGGVSKKCWWLISTFCKVSEL